MAWLRVAMAASLIALVSAIRRLRPTDRDIPVPAVLSQQTFHALQAALGVRATGPVRQTHVYPLSGRLFGLCGSSFGGAFRKDRAGGRREYRCKGARHTRVETRCTVLQRIDAEAVERAVWEAVSGVLSEPERLVAMAQDFLGLRDQRVGVERDQLAVTDGKIAGLEKAVATAYAQAFKGGLDGPALEAATGQLSTELAALRRHRDQMEAWQADAAAESDRMRRLRELADVAHRRMHSMSLEEKAAVLDLLDVRVFVAGYSPLQLRIEGVVHDGVSEGLDGRATEVVGPQGLEPCPPD